MRDAYAAWYELVSVRAVRAVDKVRAKTVLRAFEGLRKELADPKLEFMNRTVPNASYP